MAAGPGLSGWHYFLGPFVPRGKESLGFDGSRIERSPDLSNLSDEPKQGVPLNRSEGPQRRRRKTEKLYCDMGLRRFVAGETVCWSQTSIIAMIDRETMIVDQPAMSRAISPSNSYCVSESLGRSIWRTRPPTRARPTLTMSTECVTSGVER